MGKATALAKLDPRVKLALLVALSLAVFAAGPVGVALSAAVLALALAASGTTPKALFTALKPTVIVLAFALFANAIRVSGSGLVFSQEGALRGLLAVARIVIVVGYVTVLAKTTLPTQIADAISSLLSPLRALGIDTGNAAMATSVALRFVPLVSQEIRRVSDAQRARGARFDEGGITTRLSRLANVLVPVVVALFRHADELALALRDRCYGAAGRTQLLAPPAARDIAVLVLGIAAAIAIILL